MSNCLTERQITANSIPANPPADTDAVSAKELVVRQLLDNGARLAISLPEAAKLLGISKNLAYELANRADFPVLRLGGRKAVSLTGLVEWVEEQATERGRNKN